MVNKKIKKTFFLKLCALPMAMFGFSYAMVPLYDIFCEITGINGKTGVANVSTAYKQNLTRNINLNFHASIDRGLPIKFYPEKKILSVNTGKFYTTSYIVENRSNKEIIAHAVPSVAPSLAAGYFKKIECFCFSKQVFKPKEKVRMPVTFIVENGIDYKIKDISLSYNFFEFNKN